MKRFAWFDCVRFVAILLVMFAHSRDISAALSPVAAAIFQFLNLFGWAGVDLFFVLSGFLVSGLLFDEHTATGAINIKRFYIRRGFKIIPAFYVLILITAIYDAITTHRVVWVHVIHDVLFLQSYRIGAWAHAWTLAIEVHFYILLGLLLWFLSRHVPKSGNWLARLPAILCGVLVVVFLTRLINSSLRGGQNFNVHREFQPTHLHLDVLAAGVLLRYLFTYHFERLAFLTRGGILGKISWIVFGLLLVAPSADLWSDHPAIVTALIPTLNYLGFGLIIFQATQISFPTGALAWVVKPFDYLGKHSYSIYLWHLPVKEWLIDSIWKHMDPTLSALRYPGPMYFVAFVGASLVIGTIFSEALEMPVLHLRNRLFPSRVELKVPKGSETVTVAA